MEEELSTLSSAPDFVTIIFIVIAIIALAISVFVLISLLHYKNEHREKSRVESIVKDSARIRRYFQGLIPKSNNKMTLSQENIEMIVGLVLDRIEQRKGNTDPKQEVVEEIDQIQKLYANSYDASQSRFYKTSSTPFDDTIYVLYVDESKGCGEFDLFSNAKERVIKCRDFLEGACDISGNGNSISTEEYGKLSLVNGQWSVDNKLRLKFS